MHCDDAHHFGPTVTSTVFQTDVDLIGPDGGVASHPSGNGDLVLLVIGGDTDQVNISVTVGYETVK